MIQVSHLSKFYGDFPAVRDLSFEIGDGAVYGFLGPNGAGKSTTMNMITGCLSPTEGTVKIGGFDILEQPEQAKRLIGYLPEQPPLYQSETPREYLSFVGEAKGLRGKRLKEEIRLVLTLDSEDFPTFTLTLYRHNGTTCLATIDGTPTAYVTRTQTVDLIEAINQIVLDG